jgi:hypothetical protein
MLGEFVEKFLLRTTITKKKIIKKKHIKTKGGQI